MKGSWQIVTTKRKGRFLPVPSRWETLPKDIWFLIIDHVVGPKRNYQSSPCARFSLDKIPKSAKDVLCDEHASTDSVMDAMVSAVSFGTSWIQHRNAIYGKFTDIYLLRCVSRRLRDVVNAYNDGIGFYFEIGPTPRNGERYYTPETYWKSVHSGFCSSYCVCRQMTIK